ncbi:hypothetical protein ZWY2020_021424 [Hordeum vulgare]|nr:hypothetical protein ZWY2020_021424 [Hordeum vulgare]
MPLLSGHRSPPSAPPCLPSNLDLDSEANHSHDDADVVLLPDWEVLLLGDVGLGSKATCAIKGGASSPARVLGRLRGRAATPTSVQGPSLPEVSSRSKHRCCSPPRLPLPIVLAARY